MNSASAATLTFTVTASEPVSVSGTPRVAIDVGGVTRYATFSGNGSTPSTSLPFSYAVQAGDFDADGIDVSPQIDLNGATLADQAGNPLAALAFTKPDTTALKVQTYTASFTSTSDLSAVSFTINKAPIGASFSYTISSSSGPATLTGSGTIGSSSQAVSGVDVRNLPGGTLTLSVTVSDASGTGAARTDSFTPSFAYVLDGLPAAAAAYSVRRLRSGYTGPALQARRLSNGALKDIGFTAGGDLDQAALASFCGTDTCLVRFWYDQSPNGWNAFNGNPGVEPRLVNAGTMEVFGSRPGLNFHGGQRLDIQGFSGTSNEFTITLPWVERARVNGNAWLMSTTPRVQAQMPWSDGNLYFDVGGTTAPNRIQSAWPVAIGTPSVASFQNSASAVSRSVFLNGSLFLSGTGFAAPLTPFQIGTSSNGSIPEFVYFSSAISSANRLTLERSQGDYFGVSVP